MPIIFTQKFNNAKTCVNAIINISQEGQCCTCVDITEKEGAQYYDDFVIFDGITPDFIKNGELQVPEFKDWLKWEIEQELLRQQEIVDENSLDSEQQQHLVEFIRIANMALNEI